MNLQKISDKSVKNISFEQKDEFSCHVKKEESEIGSHEFSGVSDEDMDQNFEVKANPAIDIKGIHLLLSLTLQFKM